ncbi:type II secretion system protein GspM [Pseudomonas sp. SDI]|nr:type II secretion system protein GspM [Pseudomonas sp. SDI]
MPLAWATLATLLLVLALREGLGRWQTLTQWQALAVSAASLQAGARIDAEQLQQSAQARQIVIDHLQPQDGGWQVRGQLPSEQVFQDWLQQLQRDGSRPLRWGLEQAEGGLRFDVTVQP